MTQRGNEGNLVELGKAKSREIDRGNDPEPFFELDLGRAHVRICSGARLALQSATACSVR